MGRILVLLGMFITLFGVVLLLADRFHLPLGHLPGDISHHGKNVSVYFPLGTSLLLSLILSLVLYVIGRFRG
ncbi:MAG TPA: DUF2905 domain-containing protein [Terriglobales bacterium]|jgi:hypothetical protein